jgi:hypothetical protein
MRKRVQEQLKRTEYTLKTNAKDLFFNRKFDLYSLYKNATEMDLEDLNLLVNYIAINDEVIDERKK